LRSFSCAFKEVDEEADKSKGDEGLVVDRLEEDPSSSELSLFGAWTLRQVEVSDRCQRHTAQREAALMNILLWVLLLLLLLGLKVRL